MGAEPPRRSLEELCQHIEDMATTEEAKRILRATFAPMIEEERRKETQRGGAAEAARDGATTRATPPAGGGAGGRGGRGKTPGPPAPAPDDRSGDAAAPPASSDGVAGPVAARSEARSTLRTGTPKRPVDIGRLVGAARQGGKLVREAKSRWNIGLVYLQTGSYAKARENLEVSLDCHLQLFGTDARAYTSETLLAIAGVREKLGDCHAAGPWHGFVHDHYGEARRLLATVAPEEASEDITEMLARVEDKLRSPASHASADVARGVASAEAPPPGGAGPARSTGSGTSAPRKPAGGRQGGKLVREAKSRWNIGLVYLQTGSYDQARESLEHALDCHLQLFGADARAYTHESLLAIAGVREKLGDCYAAAAAGPPEPLHVSAHDQYEEARRLLETVAREEASEDITEMLARVEDKLGRQGEGTRSGGARPRRHPPPTTGAR